MAESEKEPRLPSKKMVIKAWEKKRLGVAEKTVRKPLRKIKTNNWGGRASNGRKRKSQNVSSHLAFHGGTRGGGGGGDAAKEEEQGKHT